MFSEFVKTRKPEPRATARAKYIKKKLISPVILNYARIVFNKRSFY